MLDRTAAQATLGAFINVVHVVPGLHPEQGGPSYSVPRLCEALVCQATDVSLFSVAEPGVQELYADRGGVHDGRFAWDYANIPILKKLRKSSGLARALREALQSADLVHVHGLWLLPNIQSGRIAARAKRPYLVSPRGMLAPVALKFSPIKKRLFWDVCQGAVMRGAACLHATSYEEHNDMRAMGLTNPIAVIPNGIDVPNLLNRPNNDSPERIALSLGRIHPKKGLDRLVRAWARVERRHQDWRLRIVGPNELGHAEKLRDLASRLDVERLSIEAPVYGPEKFRAYQDADLSILPTLNENFGLVVAEALAAGTPVICTKGAPWQGLETERCGWWIDHGVEPLVAALDIAMNTPREELCAMGARGCAWMRRDFSWDRIGCDMLDVYKWILGTGERPTSVRLI